MPATIRDVASAAGVSKATVSRVAAGTDYPIGAETKARVLAAIKELNYRPNAWASGLTRGNSQLVGVVAPDMSNPYYPEAVRGLEDVANERGYQVMVCSTDRDANKANTYIDALLKKRVAGLAILGGGHEIELSAADIRSYGAAAVMIGRPSSTFSTVRAQNSSAASAMTEHLIRRGHKRIGFIAGSPGSAATVERQRGYERALKTNSVSRGVVEEGGYTEAGGYAALARMMNSEHPPTAVFAANDRMALGALAALSDLGFRVPDDVALAGFDDIPMSRYVRPALTTVSVSARQLGSEAMRLLLNTEGQTARPRHIRVKTRLIIRKSCGGNEDAIAEK